MNAEAVAPPLAGGSAALMFALPAATPVALKLEAADPAGMTTDDGTVAMPGFDEESDTVVSAATFLSVCTVKVAVSPIVTVREPGRMFSESWGC